MCGLVHHCIGMRKGFFQNLEMAIQRTSEDADNPSARSSSFETAASNAAATGDVRRGYPSSTLPLSVGHAKTALSCDSPCLTSPFESDSFVYQPHSYLSLDTTEPRYDPSSPTFNKTLCFYEYLNLSLPRKKTKRQYLSVRMSDSSSVMSSDGDEPTSSKTKKSAMRSKSTSSLASRIKKTIHLNRSLDFLGHALGICSLKTTRNENKARANLPAAALQRRNTETSVYVDKRLEPDERILHKTLSADVVLHRRFVSEPISVCPDKKEHRWFPSNESGVDNHTLDCSLRTVPRSNERVSSYYGNSYESTFTDSLCSFENPGFSLDSPNASCFHTVTNSDGCLRPQSLTSEDSLVDGSVCVTRVHRGVARTEVDARAERIAGEDCRLGGSLSFSGPVQRSGNDERPTFRDANASIVRTQTPAIIVHSEARPAVTFRGHCEGNLWPSCCGTPRCKTPTRYEQSACAADPSISLTSAPAAFGSSEASRIAIFKPADRPSQRPLLETRRRRSCPALLLQPCYRHGLGRPILLPLQAGIESCV